MFINDVDEDFLISLEGGVKYVGYWPGGQSGVTCAIGFDIGHHSSLDEFNFDDDLKKKLKDYVNLKGESARLKLIEKPLELTEEEVAIIKEEVFRDEFQKFSITSLKNNLNLSNLNKDQLTSLFCYSFQAGYSNKNIQKCMQFLSKSEFKTYIVNQVHLILDRDYLMKSRRFEELMKFISFNKGKKKMGLTWGKDRTKMKEILYGILEENKLFCEKTILVNLIAFGPFKEKVNDVLQNYNKQMWSKENQNFMDDKGCMITNLYNTLINKDLLKELKDSISHEQLKEMFYNVTKDNPKITEKELKILFFKRIDEFSNFIDKPEKFLYFCKQNNFLNEKGELHLTLLALYFSMGVVYLGEKELFGKGQDVKEFIYNIYINNFIVFGQLDKHWVSLQDVNKSSNTCLVHDPLVGKTEVTVEKFTDFLFLGKARDFVKYEEITEGLI